MTRMTSEVTGLPADERLTRDDLHTMPDDGHRYRLVDGLLIVSPAPSFWHQDLLLRLAVTIFGVIPDDLTVLTAPFDVVLAQDTVIQPDPARGTARRLHRPGSTPRAAARPSRCCRRPRGVSI